MEHANVQKNYVKDFIMIKVSHAFINFTIEFLFLLQFIIIIKFLIEYSDLLKSLET